MKPNAQKVAMMSGPASALSRAVRILLPVVFLNRRRREDRKGLKKAKSRRKLISQIGLGAIDVFE
jgi:hypothetical protein